MTTHTELEEMDDWSLLVACLSPTMALVQLRPEDDRAARCFCDGFGKMTREQLEEIDALYDWSHVRDSTPEAQHNAATFIRCVIGYAVPL